MLILGINGGLLSRASSQPCKVTCSSNRGAVFGLLNANVNETALCLACGLREARPGRHAVCVRGSVSGACAYHVLDRRPFACRVILSGLGVCGGDLDRENGSLGDASSVCHDPHRPCAAEMVPSCPFSSPFLRLCRPLPSLRLLL